MSDKLKFNLTPESPFDGPEEYEERAAFCMLEISAGDLSLSEGIAQPEGRYCKGPHVSAYPLAEWCAGNWWRLLYESRPQARDDDFLFEWSETHYMYGANCGYVWPCVTIESDGVHAVLYSQAARSARSTFRYFGAPPVRVSTDELAEAMADFIAQTIALLESNGLHDTDLHATWQDVMSERADRKLSRFRRLEALLGLDPDAANAAVIKRHLADAAALGERALDELASDAGGHGETMLSADDIAMLAKRHGFAGNPNDAVRLNGATADVPVWGDAPAWRVGKAAAKAVRRQEGLDGEALSDARLAEMAGVGKRAIGGRRKFAGFSFALDGEKATRVALHSPRREGRRFELARLLGDRIVANGDGERLLPATRAYLYRQKVQRAFAAEFLSPIEAVRDMLGGDYSEENQHEAAAHFAVSDWTIRSSLRNHGYLSDEEAADLPEVF